MGRWLRPLSFSTMSLLAAACATVWTPRVVDCSSIGAQPVTQAEERRIFSAAGFAVELPRGDHWCILRSDTSGVVLGKNPFGGRTLDRPPTLAQQTHTFGALARTVTLQGTTVASVEDLRAFLDRWQQAGGLQTAEWGNMVLWASVPPGSPPSRFTTISQTFELVRIQGVDCVLSRETQEERGIRDSPARSSSC